MSVNLLIRINNFGNSCARATKLPKMWKNKMVKKIIRSSFPYISEDLILSSQPGKFHIVSAKVWNISNREQPCVCVLNKLVRRWHLCNFQQMNLAWKSVLLTEDEESSFGAERELILEITYNLRKGESYNILYEDVIMVYPPYEKTDKSWKEPKTSFSQITKAILCDKISAEQKCQTLQRKSSHLLKRKNGNTYDMLQLFMQNMTAIQDNNADSSSGLSSLSSSRSRSNSISAVSSTSSETPSIKRSSSTISSGSARTSSFSSTESDEHSPMFSRHNTFVQDPDDSHIPNPLIFNNTIAIVEEDFKSQDEPISIININKQDLNRDSDPDFKALSRKLSDARMLEKPEKDVTDNVNNFMGPGNNLFYEKTPCHLELAFISRWIKYKLQIDPNFVLWIKRADGRMQVIN